MCLNTFDHLSVSSLLEHELAKLVNVLNDLARMVYDVQIATPLRHACAKVNVGYLLLRHHFKLPIVRVWNLMTDTYAEHTTV